VRGFYRRRPMLLHGDWEQETVAAWEGGSGDEGGDVQAHGGGVQRGSSWCGDGRGG
jgi:hypothetical protein